MNARMLKGKMAEYGDTQADLAAAIGISPSNFNDKLNGKVSFRQNEIAAIRHRYRLTADEVDHIFFADLLS